MKTETMNIHDAKTNLSKVIDQVVSGNCEYIIAKAGKPMVKVIPYTLPTKKSRMGMLVGVYPPVPDDIDTPFKKDIEEMFGL
ncbi:prevent-host-death family protein [Ectopseudomonas mendocina]|uniref:Antitoxin n=1 Tax=Ectopseudomonas mendocina TaxID=300 RepID=A0A379PQ01_ECTME|nr:type II toxin-antitoxin system prevent-host-death family antitoxin [Pseudomonas mendocina]SUE95898.1 prevent-host-death family protein [Pseudomonas mendocina]